MGDLSKLAPSQNDNFVTVVSVGTTDNNHYLKARDEILSSICPNEEVEYVTVLTIGDEEKKYENRDVTEEVLVYRLPGERLGFGLKFEGGTKANEFVKRLYIQSCAPDSPASRVRCSWGHLIEGDEVLQIDSIPVNKMTRIDCVRCLKDSNVVIKLFVQHRATEAKSKLMVETPKVVEDLPQIISAEKKRTPPPPPPVPPRKIPRKLLRNNSQSKEHQPSIPPVPVRQNIAENGVPKIKVTQSPRNCRTAYSPKARDRKLSETSSIGPPDAEVYIDLFSQESVHSLSESDDTGSSISTVIDRTTNPSSLTGSLAGSLPSTPVAAQRNLHLSNLINAFDDEDVLNGFCKTQVNLEEKSEVNSVKEEEGNVAEEDNYSSSCFQDAPLSYGNEDVRLTTKEIVAKTVAAPQVSQEASSGLEEEVKNISLLDENMNIFSLPRLVDFVPKNGNNFDDDLNMITTFLDKERNASYLDPPNKANFMEDETSFMEDETDYVSEECQNEFYDDTVDRFGSKWNGSPPLATIGEVEEENVQEYVKEGNVSIKTPIVVVEKSEENQEKIGDNCLTLDISLKMETLSSDSRQPPDGHEFPDYEEQFTSSRHEKISQYYKDTAANAVEKSNTIIEKIMDSFTTKNRSYENNVKSDLHQRSQSLCDMRNVGNSSDPWLVLAEQRRKGLSKLKGLVIPDQIIEDESQPSVNIPEIQSNIVVPFVDIKTTRSETRETKLINHASETERKPLVLLSPWSQSANIPKYSPAFKRKSLQIYTPTASAYPKTEIVKTSMETDKTTLQKHLKLVLDDRTENLLDSPKSLESLNSPTRSDCSFDYITNSRNKTSSKDEDKSRHFNETLNGQSKPKDNGKSEDESDNDSAVSSSQSSYRSRSSPPPCFPKSNNLLEYENNLVNSNKEDYGREFSPSRNLKSTSIEAINRKNILASAKCRSGKDLKVASPVVNRKSVEEIPVHSVENRIECVSSPKARQPATEVSNEVPRKLSTSERKVVLEKPLEPKTPPEEEKPSWSSSHYSVSKVDTLGGIKRPSFLMRNAKSLSVNDLRKNFEKSSKVPVPITTKSVPKPISLKTSVKSVVMKTEQLVQQTEKSPEKVQNVPKTPTPSKINAIEVDSIHQIKTVNLAMENVGSTLGISLTGGSDQKIKNITIHRIRYGSVAYQEGSLTKGDRILSINGRSTDGLSQAEATELLNEPVKNFVIVVEEGRELSTADVSPRRKSYASSEEITATLNKKATHSIILEKNGAGLGFSIEGGKDSLLGDVPLIIKKIFQGGIADKDGKLLVGDEILSINSEDFTNLTRIQAWNIMKKIPDGKVVIKIYR